MTNKQVAEGRHSKGLIKLADENDDNVENAKASEKFKFLLRMMIE